MPLRTGFSHGLAAFFGVLFASVIGEYVRLHSETLYQVTVGLGRLVTGVFGLHLSESVVGVVLTTAAIAFGWGTVYHVARFE